jgi:putative glutamine amidotransferase
MAFKPVVGINADYREGDSSFSFIMSGYYECVAAAGGIPLVVPPIEKAEDIGRVLDRMDAFVLIGGADLDPRRDGFMLHPTVKTMHPRREDFDRLLMDQLAKHRIPTFGIGAGMQLLNVSQGGNLFLHIPEDMPSALPHRDPQDPSHRHGLVVVPGSLMERVYGDGEIRVNSRHHMAVDEVATGFTVTARCPDGIVEAIESTSDEWLAMGTQFHPESDSASALDVRIVEEFMSSIKGSASRLVA